MTVIRAAVVRCDHPGCSVEFLSRGSELPFIARQDSTGKGWSAASFTDRFGQVRTSDSCPEHSTPAHQEAS